MKNSYFEGSIQLKGLRFSETGSREWGIGMVEGERGVVDGLIGG